MLPCGFLRKFPVSGRPVEKHELRSSANNGHSEALGITSSKHCGLARFLYLITLASANLCPCVSPEVTITLLGVQVLAMGRERIYRLHSSRRRH